MNDGTDTLRARLNKHAAEIATLEERHLKEVKRWKGIAIVEFVTALVVFAFTAYTSYNAKNHTWRSDAAPKLERLTVVTEGFVGKDGRWRSFDTGEKITVNQWRP